MSTPRPVDGTDMADHAPAVPSTDAVVADLAALGPFFTLHTHPADSPVTEPWLVMRELVTNPALLSGRITAVRTRLAAAVLQTVDAVPLRVAASTAQMGLVARLVSPALALSLINGQAPDMDLAHLRWQPLLGGPFPLSVPVAILAGSTGTGGHQDAPASAQQAAAVLTDRVINGPVLEIIDATRSFSVSTRVLWGNVASAVNGAARMIATARPPWAHHIHALASSLLSRPPLRDTSTHRLNGTFQRRSCCLIYQATPAADGPVCGDCVLTTRPTRGPRGRQSS